MLIEIKIKGQYCYFQGMLPTALLNGIDKTLSFEVKGAEYIKGDWDGVWHCFNREFKSFQIGHLDEVIKIIKLFEKVIKEHIEIKIIDLRNQSSSIPLPNQIYGKTLLPYQIEAVERFLENKIGNIQIPTGGGKTLISAEITRRISKPTLFVVNRTILLHQTRKEYEKLFQTKIGIIGDGCCEIQPITVTTIQSINRQSKNQEVQKYLQEVNLVIFDESHFCAAESFMRFGILIPNAIYRLGLSATVRRDDGKDLLISAVTGPIIYDVPAWVIEQEGIIIQPKCYFIENKEIEPIQEYHESYFFNIVRGDKRNETIKQICEVFKDKKILIVVGRIEHGQILSTILPSSMLVNGIINKKERRQKIEEFETLDSNILIGTNSIFATGYNNPAIDIIINAGANAGFNLTIQTVGRVMRACAEKNKTEAIFIDFMDKGEGFSFHTGHSWARFKALRETGYNVKIVDNIYNLK